MARSASAVLLLAVLLGTTLAVPARAAGPADPRELPACVAFDPVPESWTQRARQSFALHLPPELVEQPRGPSLDHEFAEFRGGAMLVQYQYGFAVTEIAGWLDDAGVTGCRFDLDGVAAALLERAVAGEPNRFAIGLFDFVTTYHGEFEAFTGTSSLLSDDLVVYGEGEGETAFVLGRAIASSFRWSKLPVAAAGPWTVAATMHNGVFAHWDGDAATVFLATFSPATGAPEWIGGGAPMPTAHAARVIDGEIWLAQPVPFVRVARGRFPGASGASGEPAPWGHAELRVRADCAKAELAIAADGSTPQVLALERVLGSVGTCDRFAR